ncbi:MAG: hypothetical protein NC906_01580 [Candidatus Omnitrophica bacterium]|nr:hypothetical protein [Candidatus Omnitrophota bacterium]
MNTKEKYWIKNFYLPAIRKPKRVKKVLPLQVKNFYLVNVSGTHNGTNTN